MKPEYEKFVKQYPKLSEQYEVKKVLSAEQAKKLIMEIGTDEQKAMIDQIKDGGKPITITEKRFRGVNTKRRIMQMIKDKRSDRFIGDWIRKIIVPENVSNNAK